VVRLEHASKRVLTFFQDEARFGQKGTLARVWARRGSRPEVPRQHQYDYLYVFGAACAETGDAVALVAPHANTAVMNHFLQQFSRSLASDVHAVMILDQALRWACPPQGWHVSGDLVVPANVTLKYLPPRSPELNPIENLWHWITSHYWSNRVHADYATMLDSATDALRQTFRDKERVKTICSAPYLVRANQG
jgi:hypothetical protein